MHTVMRVVGEETLINYITGGRYHGSLGSFAIFCFHQQPERRRLGFAGIVPVVSGGGVTRRGGVGVLWRVRSNAERGIAACGMWAGCSL
jgi:hypothetical protein